MTKLILSAAAAAVAFAGTPALADPPSWAPAHGKRAKEAKREYKQARREYREARRDYYRNYDYNRADPRYGNYYANRYYQPNGYQPYTMGYNDRVYRGSDGRYYCRRSDGTTGLVIGGALGGLLGSQLRIGGSSTLSAILGAAGGAIAGRAIERGQVQCR